MGVLSSSSARKHPSYGATLSSLPIRRARLHPVIADDDLRRRTPADFRLLALVHHHYAGRTVCQCIANALNEGASVAALLDDQGRVHCDDCLVLFMECVECSTRLLQAHFPLNARAPSGATPLYYALLGNNVRVACMLLEGGAHAVPRPPNREEFLRACRLCIALPALLASVGLDNYLSWMPAAVQYATCKYVWFSTEASYAPAHYKAQQR